MSDGSLNLFRLGARGVNVVTAPTHLTDDELTSGQNAEVVSAGGEFSLDQRPGMTRVNATAINSGAAILAVHDVLAAFLSDYTPYLYAGLATGQTHHWKRSADGVTWTQVDLPAKSFAANASIGASKNWPKAATVGKNLYYVDAGVPIAVHLFDGVRDTILSTVPPAVTGTVLTTPSFYAAFAETENVGATTYTYKIVAKQGSAFFSAPFTVTVTVGPAALSATNFIDLSSANHAGFQNNYLMVAGATSFDIYRTVGGGSTGKIGTIPVIAGALSRGNGSGATGSTFGAYALAVLSAGGSDAGGSYTYKLVNVKGANHGVATAGVTLATGNTTLSATQYNRIIPSGGEFYTPEDVDVYRTAGGGSTGKIGTIATGTIPYEFHDTGLVGDASTAPTTGSGLSTRYADGVGDPIFTDAGLTGDATTASATASGGAAGEALAVLDTITDGTFIYFAVVDLASADPTVYGRILKFDPASSVWSQIGATFFTASGNGAAGTLAFFDGALSYGTYIGTASGNTSYLTSTSTPLPAGGIAEVHTTAASQATCAIVVFNGEVYAGYISLVAATAAIVAKRAAINVWTTVRTGPATAVGNAYTSLGVFNGYIFAGWSSGDGATAARIESSSDGIVWTLEVGLGNTETPWQMVVFNNALYVATPTRILKRTASGTWSSATFDTFAGCIGVVYL